MGIDAVHWKAVDIAVESFKQVKPKSAESTGDGALQSPPAQDDTHDDWLLKICDYEFITGLKTPESSMLPDKLRYENLMRRNAFLPLGIAYDEECQADAVYVLIGDSKPQRPKQPYLASSVFNCICNILGRHISRRKLHMILLFAGPQVVDRAIGHFYFRIDIGGDAPPPPSDAGRLSIHLDPSDPRHIKWVKELLLQAVNRDTSDVHFEPGEEEGRVRLRIDGDLHMVDPIPRQLFENVTNYLKIAARMNVANRRSPQDSRIQMVYPLGRKDKFGRELEREIDVRVSTLPTFCGEKMVMRLLDPRKNAELAANGLGHVIESKHLCKRFESVLGFRDGIVLVTGPTGCGKSTTLNASLFHLLSIHKDKSNIVTIEDPVEYRVPGVNQIAVDESAGLTFGEALRHILRQDPDIVLVGEIRDKITATTAVQAAQTGHLILATLHTNDALGAVDRLQHLGASHFMIASTVRLLQAQRLIKKLCPKCGRRKRLQGHDLKRKVEATLRLAPFVDRLCAPDSTVFEADTDGCPACEYKGYHERIAVMEMVRITPPMAAAIEARVNAQELYDVAYRSGYRPMVANGVELVCSGITSIDQIEMLGIEQEVSAETPEPTVEETPINVN